MSATDTARWQSARVAPKSAVLRFLACFGLVLLVPAAPSPAQVGAPEDAEPVQPLSGRTADSAIGQIGQRQTRERLAEELGVEPMARIANRVQNRVQNRIRNRIDRDYDPRANATNPFEVAEDQQRSAGRPRRR